MISIIHKNSITIVEKWQGKAGKLKSQLRASKMKKNITKNIEFKVQDY